MHVNICRGLFRSQSNIYGGTSLRKPHKGFVVAVQLGSKYVAGIGFAVEKVYRMSIFI